jgi:rhodanese-related sulfurtransferase
MKRLTKIVTCVLLCCSLIGVGYAMLTPSNKELAKVHQIIMLQFAEVKHISGADLTSISAKDIILYDVREPSEYKISHLKNAIQVDPDITENDFIAKFSAISKGKTAIFYCSVGQRSSSLADRVQVSLKSSGTKAAYNLEGGIFKWHNEHRPLYASVSTPTQYVHPYDPVWGRMVTDQAHARY